MWSPIRSGELPGWRHAILSARYPRAATKESSLASSWHRATEVPDHTAQVTFPHTRARHGAVVRWRSRRREMIDLVARSREERIKDTLEDLRTEVDVWIATASGSGAPYLV